MPKPTKGKRLGANPAHERMILANLATALFEHRRITTTETKARRLRPFAERLITKAKRGDLHARRQVHSVIRDKSVVHFLFAEIGPSFASRPGGYTRITKIGPRRGDNAPMAVIELVEPMPEGATTGSAPAAESAPAASAPVEAASEAPTEAAEEPTQEAAPETAEDAAEVAESAAEASVAEEAAESESEEAADEQEASDGAGTDEQKS